MIRALLLVLQTIASKLNPGGRSSSPWLTAVLATFDPDSLTENPASISRGLRRDRPGQGSSLRHCRQRPLIAARIAIDDGPHQ
ncbi:uncharacterized protein BO97DRAFT_66676 [Aspergillus homomorphus CBS 101889]|uniref:Uncharacterized protein n=1 Tax=Aspergillus homomorphus (strain CBS 101889) TaxID=1450537 RepID=A0A395HX03_ASPHC|nr:hypothetical protein BO97DRAFT_66676 [Aspergillus homomorphus CBS 101889]RAL11943.1 hypothetical protein BO97DRAFT_66676 [Aspergillus homomorphus CBS 101889]